MEDSGEVVAVDAALPDSTDGDDPQQQQAAVAGPPDDNVVHPQAYYDDEDDPAVLEIIRRANEAAMRPEVEHAEMKPVDAMTVTELTAAFTMRRAKFGKHSEEAMAVAARLVELHTAAQDWAKAEPFLKAIVDTKKAKCGPSDGDTLVAIRQLIDVQCRQGKHRVVSMALTASAKTYESVYGATDKMTLDVKVTWATCQLRHRKEAQAVELFRSVYAAVCKLEADDNDLGYGLGPAYKLAVLSPYCEALVAVQAWDEADQLLAEAVDLSRRVAGGAAHDTLRLLVRHAAVKVQRGHAHGADAEELYAGAVAALAKAHGETHAETVEATTAYADLLFQRRKGGPPGPALNVVNDAYATLVNTHKTLKYGSDESEGCFEAYSRIAEVHELQGSLPAAENILRRAVYVAERVYGDMHTATLAAVLRLANVVHRQQDGKLSAKHDAARSEEVVALYRRVLAGWKLAPMHGPTHPETLKVIALLADLYYHQDDRADAVELLERGLAACERLDKTPHKIMYMAFETSKMYRLTADFTAAEEQIRRVLAWRAGAGEGVTSDDADVLSVRTELGLTMLDQHRYQDALTVLEALLAPMEKTLGAAHPQTLTVMRSVARSLIGQAAGDPASPHATAAVDMARTCLQRSEDNHGKSGSEAVSSVAVLSDALIAVGLQDEAERLLQTKMSDCEADRGGETTEVADLALTLGKFHFAVTQRASLARSYSEKASRVYTTVLSPRHPKARHAKSFHSVLLTKADGDDGKESEQAAEGKE